ncbi:MAG: PD-(D/E)XK nuclease family protein [Candidatus Omnitrophica bacterium]|nr:PD-(D/E)XK nuclease family protein [Candidatus Omnitrophota bacterium]
MPARIRSRNIYDPASKEPFKISRSKIESFIRCPRCFYLDRRRGVGQPSSPPFNLNIAVDHLLKKEFDEYRAKKTAHPLMVKFGIEAVPFDHPSMDIWRNPFTGIQFLHPSTRMLVFGGVDDVWVSPQGRLMIVDYKATSTDSEINLDDPWKAGYKRQLEIYQWLFRKNGFEVDETGYFVYCNGVRHEPVFHNRLNFDTVILAHKGNDGWIEGVLGQLKACLDRDVLPNSSEGCEFCAYRAASRSVEMFQSEIDFGA